MSKLPMANFKTMDKMLRHLGFAAVRQTDSRRQPGRAPLPVPPSGTMRAGRLPAPPGLLFRGARVEHGKMPQSTSALGHLQEGKLFASEYVERVRTVGFSLGNDEVIRASVGAGHRPDRIMSACHLTDLAGSGSPAG